MRFIRRHSIAIFIALNLLASAVGIAAHSISDPVLRALLLIPLAASPCLTALFLTWVSGRWTAIRELLGRLLVWRVPVRWYLLTLFGFPAISFAAILIGYARLGELPRFLPPGESWLPGIFTPLFIGAMAALVIIGEEVGWRGYLQEQLQKRWRALDSALLVGVVWALWHGDRFVHFPRHLEDSALFLIHCIALAIILAWIYRNTGRSLLLAGLGHASSNVGIFLFGLLATRPEERQLIPVFNNALLILFCAGIVWSCGRDLQSAESAR